MNTHTISAGVALVLVLVATLTLGAQTASTTDYDFLLSISEPARFDLYERGMPTEDHNVVPVASPLQAEIDFSHPLPKLADEVKDPSSLSVTEHLQLATAFRLRGDYVQAVPHYAQVVKLSKQPIHAFFYAQALRATGQDLLADLYDARYVDGHGGALEEQPLSIAEHSGIPAMIYGQVVNDRFGNPIPNVEVRLVNVCTEEELVTTTDKEGNFRFRDHPADCAFFIRFEKKLFQVALIKAAAPYKDKRFNVELDAMHELREIVR